MTESHRRQLIDMVARPEDEVDLARASLLMACEEYPDLDVDGYLQRFDLMAADAWVYLGALARETKRIRLGTLVSPVTFRHPSVLAKMAVTADHIAQVVDSAPPLTDDQLDRLSVLLRCRSTPERVEAA